MSRQCFRNNLLIMAAVVLTAVSSHAAQPEKKTDEPILITSDRMEAEKLGDKVTFTGNVVLKKEGMTISSDSMTVFYDTGSKDIKQVRQVEAQGNVVVRKENRVAFANKALYYSQEEKIVLTGDARIIENENQLGGEKITLYLRDDRSVIEGGKVLLYQEKADRKFDKPAEERKEK